jgi:hypothetical protein
VQTFLFWKQEITHLKQFGFWLDLDINRDIVGQILWYVMFFTPLITIPIVWRLNSQNKIIKFLIGLILAFILSSLLYYISIHIAFKNFNGL